jgi:hypothetical protein
MGALRVTLERLAALLVVLVINSYDLLELIVFACRHSGFPQSAAELFRLHAANLERSA